MEPTANATCPFCGEANAVPVDVSESETTFVTDCENCCRPFEVRARCEAGEVLILEVGPA